MHRPSRPPASHAQSAAAQRDRPCRRRARSGRRQHDARPRRHDGGAAGAEGAADDPDALLQHVHPAALPRAGAAAVGGRDERGADADRVEDEPAGQAAGDRVARPLSIAPTSDVDAGGERVLLDKLAARLDDVAHQLGEDVVGLVDRLHVDLQQRTGVCIERGFPELVGVHLAKAFVALQ